MKVKDKQTFNAKSSNNSFSPAPNSAEKNQLGVSPMYGFNQDHIGKQMNQNQSYMNVVDQEQRPDL